MARSVDRVADQQDGKPQTDENQVFIQIHEIHDGPIQAHRENESREQQNRALIGSLQAGGVQMKAAAPATRDGPLSGQSFVISGGLADFSRPEAEARIRSLGGSTGSSVTKKTDVLVVGKSPGSKLEKAERYGTTILNDDEFMSLLRQHGSA